MNKLTIETDDSGIITNLGLEALESLFSTVKISLTVAKRKNRKGSVKVANLACIKFNAENELMKLVPDLELVKDFLSTKKKAGSVFNKTVFDRFVAKCNERNLDFRKMLVLNIVKRWRGFELNWIDNLPQDEKNEYGINTTNYGKSDSGKATNGNNQGYRPAKANITEVIQRFTDDAATGNIPGVYKKLDSGDVGEIDK